MQAFQVAQQFIEEAELLGQLGALRTLLEHAIIALGFRYFACGSHVDPLHPNQGIIVLNYPSEWVEAYSSLQLHRIDPVFRCADRNRLPFYWDDAEFLKSLGSAQRRMLRLARNFGVQHGYTIPIHGPDTQLRTPSSCSLIPDSRSLSEQHYLAAQLVAYYAFDRAARLAAPLTGTTEPRLTTRECECLEFVAQGKDDWSIGMLLNLSEATVHHHIEQAKKRFGVSTRRQAVVQALATHQIHLRDVVPIRMPRRTNHK